MPDEHPAGSTPARQVIPEALMLERIARSEDMREFFIQMWLQNPGLAKQGGAKVREIIAPLAPFEERLRQWNPSPSAK